MLSPKLSILSLLASFTLLSQSSAAATTTLVPFDQWEHQRLQLADVNIHFRYAGSGPPILLVHGFPQHSLTWHTIGPLLAQNYTVIAPDIRGCGQSTIPRNDGYTAQTAGADLKGVLDFLGINRTYALAHDKGVGLATALAAANDRDLVKRLALVDYPLPGFGYEESWIPSRDWDLRAPWQLAAFSVSDVALRFFTGRERELLDWHFYVFSYSGNSAVSYADLDEYTRTISRAGFLRSGLTCFAVDTVFADSAFFNNTLRQSPLEMPLLGMGGEASLTGEALERAYSPLGTRVQLDTVPKAGHWIGDENPQWVAQRVNEFLAEDDGIPAVDLSYLKNQVGM